MNNDDELMTIRVTRTKMLGVLTLLLLSWAPGELGCETFTLQTYYPSPVGVYNKLTTTGDTLLARDGGNVGIGTGVVAPAYKLDVTGTIRFRTGPAATGVATGMVLVSDANGVATWGWPTYAP